jgi:hypothetical protein
MIKIGLGLPGQNFYTSSNGYAIAFSTAAERSAKFENGAFKELNKKWRQLEIPAGTLFSIQTLPGLVKKWTPERQPGIGTIFSLSGACRNIQFKSGRNIV